MLSGSEDEIFAKQIRQMHPWLVPTQKQQFSVWYLQIVMNWKSRVKSTW